MNLIGPMNTENRMIIEGSPKCVTLAEGQRPTLGIRQQRIPTHGN